MLKRLDDVAWADLTHAYGPATEVPELIRALRGPGHADALAELYGSITHQGSRYPATVAVVPFLVEVATAPDTPDRPGVLGLLQFAAVGYPKAAFDARRERRLLEDGAEVDTWMAVRGLQHRLRPLLDDPEPEVAGHALRILAWTGDTDPAVGAHLDRELRADHDGRRADAWLASVVLRRRSPTVDPTLLASAGPASRFAAACAALTLAGAMAPVEAVDELVACLTDLDGHDPMAGCAFLSGEDPPTVAVMVLSEVPPQLVDHTSARLLEEVAAGHLVADEALAAYVRLNIGWPDGPRAAAHLDPHQRAALHRLVPALRTGGPRAIWELTEQAIPAEADALAVWLAG